MTILTVVVIVFLALSFLMNCIIFYIIIKTYMNSDKEAFKSVFSRLIGTRPDDR